MSLRDDRSAEPGTTLRWIPAVHELLAAPPPAIREAGAGEALERAALERAIGSVRADLRAGRAAPESEDAVRAAVEERWAGDLARLLAPALAPVVNATGVVVHTNLGRAPLAAEAAEAAGRAGARYTPLEYDLAAGERGSRYAHAVPLLRLLTGAEDGVVVNNNAAALLLAVDTLAGGRAVVVSRGELVEIGGGFRIHEIVSKSGAAVVEVGATNKTHPEDVRRALDAHDVGALLKVHRSNFAQTGFVAEVALDELVAIGAERGVPVIFDQGTGLVAPLAAAPAEPTLREAVEGGVALACGSGDKLLGGPQAGLLVGRAEALAAVRANPLLRALRVDAMTLAALDATLRATLADPDAVPARRMVGAPEAELRARAEALLAALWPTAAARCRVAPHEGRAGGGTLPATPLPGWAVRVEPPASASAFAARLRAGDPPIVARVADDAVWIDPRAFLPGDAAVVADRLNALLADEGDPP